MQPDLQDQHNWFLWTTSSFVRAIKQKQGDDILGMEWKKELEMPFEYVWKPAPKNMSLPVFLELPDGFVENYIWSFVKKIRVACSNKYEFAYFCHFEVCNGWIPGEPMGNEEYAILSGRNGTAYYCCRCGNEISFVSKLS